MLPRYDEERDGEDGPDVSSDWGRLLGNVAADRTMGGSGEASLDDVVEGGSRAPWTDIGSVIES